MFQWLMDAVVVAQGTFDLASGKSRRVKQDTKKQEATVKSEKFSIDVNVKLPEKEAPEGQADDHIDLFFQNLIIDDLYQKLSKERDGVGNRIEVLEVVLRSPERMVRFLGDTIEAQELAKDKWIPMILHEERPVPLFLVKRGHDLMRRAAVGITEPEGEQFVIPISENSAPHLSLRTLSLVMEFLNSAVSGKSLPPPNTLIISGG